MKSFLWAIGVLTFVLLSFFVSPQSPTSYNRGNNWEETCDGNKCSRTVYGYDKYVLNASGQLELFTDVYTTRFENGAVNVSWWEGSFAIKPSVIYNGNEYSIAQIKSAYPSVDMQSFIFKTGNYKYGFNFSGIPESIMANVQSIKFQLTDAYGITWSDVSKREGKLYIKDRLVLDFRDLQESGYILNLVNKTTLLVSNVSNKTSFSLDPSISPQPGETVGIDTWIEYISSDPELANNNWGAWGFIRIGKETARDQMRGLIKPNWTGMGLETGNVSSIDSLVISLELSEAPAVAGGVKIHQMFTCWEEGTNTGASTDGNVSWNANSTAGATLWNGSVAGVNHNATFIANTSVSTTVFYNWSVPGSVADSMFKGTVADCGFIKIGRAHV